MMWKAHSWREYFLYFGLNRCGCEVQVIQLTLIGRWRNGNENNIKDISENLTIEISLQFNPFQCDSKLLLYDERTSFLI